MSYMLLAINRMWSIGSRCAGCSERGELHSRCGEAVPKRETHGLNPNNKKTMPVTENSLLEAEKFPITKTLTKAKD